ncbi:heme oxygenase-like protein [Exidia glandulosa HHB12029]|uniref:Heme oxygenase-like protein n=1 Tax=Exidia glandulosa HHB12029 TaxID=1314781 RepID=A0A165JS60_EXIGL|nr:heme oxygenase-like protein [Exidia glandulosa HHB12029]
MTSNSTSITADLRGQPPKALWEAATQHSFLTAAGSGTLSDELLGFWLAQDRIYAAHAYPRFIGNLIARIPFSPRDGMESNQEKEKDNREILDLLVFSLQNVVREVGFFEETARTFNLQLAGWKIRKGTRDYEAEMARVSTQGTLAEGLLFLWAMEEAYFSAWKYVASLGSNQSAAVKALVNNWTSPDFEAFVTKLAGLVDRQYATSLQATYMGDLAGTFRDTMAVWERVLELEAAFWPVEDELRKAQLYDL